MKVIGLTGGIACGKSTVARLMTERFGVPVVDADQIARAVVAPGQPALTAIVDQFGPEMVQADGSLDRAALRAVIMTDADARARLERITHPAIFSGMRDQLAGLENSGVEHAIVEAALMVETGSYRSYPELIVVSCAPETQIRRVMARDGVDEDQAKATLAAQLPLAAKEAVATQVIRNDGGLPALIAEVDRVAVALGLGLQ